MHLGRAFQIADDLLDLCSDSDVLGKAVRKDAQAGKQTFPACVGVEASRAEVQREVQAAIQVISRFGEQGDDLAEMARYAGYRNY
jgi:farnesyl diphosphate synthase